MTQSLQELEKDIEQSRAKLDLTIDRLQDKMSVSGVVDDMLGTARRGPYAPMFDNMLETVRRNPVPVMLIAAGLGLLAYRLTRKRPVVRHRSQLVTETDVVAVPVDPRIYNPGAAPFSVPDEPFEPRRGSATSRI
jgi:hypothetical protein